MFPNLHSSDLQRAYVISVAKTKDKDIHWFQFSFLFCLFEHRNIPRADHINFHLYENKIRRKIIFLTKKLFDLRARRTVSIAQCGGDTVTCDGNRREKIYRKIWWYIKNNVHNLLKFTIQFVHLFGFARSNVAVAIVAHYTQYGTFFPRLHRWMLVLISPPPPCNRCHISFYFFLRTCVRQLVVQWIILASKAILCVRYDRPDLILYPVGLCAYLHAVFGVPFSRFCSSPLFLPSSLVHAMNVKEIYKKKIPIAIRSFVFSRAVILFSIEIPSVYTLHAPTTHRVEAV